MANAVYPVWKENLIQATSGTALNGSGTTGVYFALVNTTSYVYNATHDFYNDLIGSPDAIIGTDQEVGATKTYANGTFDGANLTYTSVTGSVVGALVGYVKNAGANSTWRLVVYLDTSVTGLPLTPNGGDITVTWNASGIFTLSQSDAKQDINEIGNVGIAKLYEYRYRGSRERQIGFLAHEVERFAPEAICRFGGIAHVDYGLATAKALQLAA